MRALVAVLVVLFVAGDCETTRGFLGEDVLLQCSCSGIVLGNGFDWQMEGPIRKVVQNRTPIDTYKGRVETFLAESKNNCSLLLKNITAEDQGKYRCSFLTPQYQRQFVFLSVSDIYSVCQKNFSAKELQCDVKGRFRDAEIQWILDGTILTNSVTTEITHTYTWDASKGLHHFSSRLISTHSMTSEPVCDVKAKGITADITKLCEPDDPEKVEQKRVWMYSIIPVMLVPGFGLAWLCFRCLRRAEERRAENYKL